MSLNDNTNKIAAILAKANALPDRIETGVDTSDATAAAEDIVKDKTAYVNGEKVTGSREKVTQLTGSVTAKIIQNGLARFIGKVTQNAAIDAGKIIGLSLGAEELGDANDADVVKGKTYTSAAGFKRTGTKEEAAAPSLQSKSVTYTANGTDTITPDEGYDGLSSVDVTVDVAGSGGGGEPPFKIVTWAGGTDEEIVKMVQLADEGKINLSDYWAVGDTRTVQLSAMSATGVDESHAAQTVDLVLMHAGGYDLNAAVASGRTKCSFVVGLKDSLTQGGYMNSSGTNSGSWNGSARRTWCNNVFRNAIPSTLRAIFKQFKTVTAQTYNGSTNQTSVDYFALPAEKEIFGSRTYSNETEFNALFQFDYYKTASNRVKKLGKTGDASFWWERSPGYDNSARFCYVNSNGNAKYSSAYGNYGLAPFGCI